MFLHFTPPQTDRFSLWFTLRSAEYRLKRRNQFATGYGIGKWNEIRIFARGNFDFFENLEMKYLFFRTSTTKAVKFSAILKVCLFPRKSDFFVEFLVAFIGWWGKQVNPSGLRLKIAGLHKRGTPLGSQGPQTPFTLLRLFRILPCHFMKLAYFNHQPVNGRYLFQLF